MSDQAVDGIVAVAMFILLAAAILGICLRRSEPALSRRAYRQGIAEGEADYDLLVRQHRPDEHGMCKGCPGRMTPWIECRELRPIAAKLRGDWERALGGGAR